MDFRRLEEGRKVVFSDEKKQKTFIFSTTSNYPAMSRICPLART
jgi:hypothetical protein